MRNPALEARPASWKGASYTLCEGEREVAQVALHRRDEGAVTVGDVPFVLGSGRNRYVLLFEGVEVARAVQPSLWRRLLKVRINGSMLDRASARAGAADVDLVLQAANPFVRTFEVFEGERCVGRIRPRGVFLRRVAVELPPYLPLAVRAFLFALVAIQWRRASRQAAGS